MKILVGLVVVVAIIFGVNYMTAPRYEVIKKELSISFNKDDNKYKIAPAEIKVTNLWKSRPLTLKVEVSGMASNGTYEIRPTDILEKDFIKLNEEDYKITVYPTDFDGDNQSKYVIITIEKLKMWDIDKNQQQSYKFAEVLSSEKGKISIGRTYIFDIFME